MKRQTYVLFILTFGEPLLNSAAEVLDYQILDESTCSKTVQYHKLLQYKENIYEQVAADEARKTKKWSPRPHRALQEFKAEIAGHY